MGPIGDGRAWRDIYGALAGGVEAGDGAAGPLGLLGDIAAPDRLILHSKNLPLPTEVFLASAVGAFWVYHRGAHCIRRPLAGITRHRDGIPFLAPEVALLFTSRSNSDKGRRLGSCFY